jgi:hypothetical protein
LPDESTIGEVITRYVLGELSEEEELSIEDKYALDPDFSDLVNAVEDDLVVAYVLNRLPRAKQEQFERFFLRSPENCEKVTFTEVLLRHMQQDSAGKIAPAYIQSPASAPSSPTSNVPSALWGSLGSRAARFALAVIILIALGSGLWLLTRNRNSQRPINQESSSTPLSENLVKPAEPRSEPVPNNPPVISKTPERNTQSLKRTTTEKMSDRHLIASFILSPGVTRAPGDTTRIEIPKNAMWVRLQLSIDATVVYASYQASIEQVGGREIWSHKVQNRRGKRLRSLTLLIPANLLSSGEYIITLGGTTQPGKAEILADYSVLVTDAK